MVGSRKENARPSNTVQQRPSTPPKGASHKQYGSYSDSPPRTPPSQISRLGKSKGAGGVKAPRNRPALRDTFGNQVLDADETYHSRNRSSHELSWSPNRNARASVVDNMLASFDQFSGMSLSHQTTATTQTTTTTTTISQQTDNGSFHASQRFASVPTSRPRSHTASSSISSDYSLHADSHSPQSRGHRSNSSSNFQTSLGRIDSVRASGEINTIAGASNNSGGPSRPSMAHPQARKGSRGSGTSSVDLGAIGSPRWQPNVDRRSSSFDQGHNRTTFTQQGPPVTASPRTTGPRKTLFHEGFDSAPNSGAHSGAQSSRDASPSRPSALRSGSALSNTLPPPTRRRGSLRSPMALFNRPESGVLDPSEGQKTQVANPIRVPEEGTRASSTKTPEKLPTGSAQNPPGSNSASNTKEKERPGFFKRVFGSSKTNQPTTPAQGSTPPRKSGSSQQATTAPKGNENIPPNAQSRKVGKTAQGSGPPKPIAGEKPQPKEQQIHTLNKKSSFFRRRKKSVSDASNVPVPPLQLQLHFQNEQKPSQKSPTNSLRDAMDTYFNEKPDTSLNSAGTPQVSHNRRGSDSPGKSTIRKVQRPSENDTIVLPPARMPFSGESDDDDDRNYLTVKDIESKTPTRHSETSRRAKERRVPPPSPININVHKKNASSDWKDLDVSMINYDSDKPKSSPRLWITPDESDLDESTKRENPSRNKQANPKAAEPTLSSGYQSEISKHESPKEFPTTKVLESGANSTSQPAMVEDTRPTEHDQLQAEKLFTGESDIPMSDAAAWLGEAGPERARIRRAYMEVFDWQNMCILTALRRFCNQIRLKGESQQVDRLLDALAARWCECNPDHGFKATDVVHTVCYSLLLLNTDLHLADIDQKMTRSQFIKNTMPTIRRVVTDAAPNSFATARHSMLPPPKPAFEDHGGSAESPTMGTSPRPTHKLSSRPSDHSGNEGAADAEHSTDECGPLVKAPFNGKQSAWEAQIEVVLKNFYNSIRQERLPLVKSGEPKALENQASSTSLAGSNGTGLRRSNSLLSKTGSEAPPTRGRFMDSRSAPRWSSKNRSRPRLYQSSLGRASRTSVDDDNMSAISPSASSMWSKYSLGKTQTSMSVNSYSSEYPPRGDYQRSIGFANALSQAIIREDTPADSQEEVMRVLPLLEDESLELAGAPWAKEGMLKHKHHLEAVDKKAKDRNWNECFAVVDKGWMRLFQFNASARSIRQKARNQKLAGGVVGGGNWTENAEALGKFSLRQTIASALPPPGYSRARPHVFALSLPNGAVHLFQVGTPEIVREFVSSVNYWSARMSKEPLVGGVSNIEYGWSDAAINTALVEPRPSSAMTGPRPSIQSSIRGSIDQAGSKPKLPGDRIIIYDWSPPTVSMMESQLLEVDQLRALTNYVKNIEEELAKHQELRPAISLAFSPRHPNSARAMNNWERKSSYLLREIVKFRTYIDSLQQAQVMKEKVYKEREEYEKVKEKLKQVDSNTAKAAEAAVEGGA